MGLSTHSLAVIAATVAAIVLDQHVWAARVDHQQLGDSVESYNASVEAQSFKLPRPCKNSWRDSNDCCMCSHQRGRSSQQLGVNIDTCVSFDHQSNQPCCETWATDCKEEDPWFQKQFRKECTVPPEICGENECASVLADLKDIDDMLDEFDDQRRKIRSKTLKRKYIRAKGKRREESMGCPTCECGEPVLDHAKPDTPLQCKAKQTAWCVLATRDCCTNLKDCTEQDDWPRLINKNYEEYRKIARKIDAKKKEGMEVRSKALKLESQCVKHCQDYRRPICLDWMKKNQQADVQQKWNSIKAAYDRSEAEAEATARNWDERISRREKQRQERLDAESYSRQREGQQEMIDNFRRSMKDTLYEAADLAKGLLIHMRA